MVALSLRGLGREVVVVVRERRKDEPVLVERSVNTLGLGVVERVGLDVAGRERAVSEVRPGGELQRLVAVAGRPGSDLLEAAFRHAGGQKAELHVATARESSVTASTSTHRSSREDVKTASVMCAARSPSEKVGIPSAVEPLRTPS